jgi:hypothetical protein
MARNFSGKISELLKITATLALAGQIITEKEHRPTGADSDRRGEIPPHFLLGRSQLENLHHGDRSTNRSQPRFAEKHRAAKRQRESPRTAQRPQTRLGRLHHHAHLAQENPKRLDDRTQEWIDDVQPRNAIERDLTAQAARLTLDIERAERIGMPHLAHRVLIAARLRTRKLSARRRKQVHELGRRLLYVAGPEEVKVDKQALGDDAPGLPVGELEESAEGCRWLLERWAEYRNLLDHRSKWEEPVLIRFIRLQGKRLVESVFDPVLNSIFLAWDVLVPNYAKVEWESFQEEKPITDPAYNHRLQWREIAARPSNAAEARAVLSAIVAEHVGRLEELLAQNQAIEAIEDPTWADRAALDCSPAFERHRRYQSAKTRELLRTLETLRKMRNSECGMGDGEGEMADGKSQMADGKMPKGRWRRMEGRWRRTEGRWRRTEGRWRRANSRWRMSSARWRRVAAMKGRAAS